MFGSDRKKQQHLEFTLAQREQAVNETAQACALMADAEMRNRAKIRASYRSHEGQNRAHQWSMGVQAEALRDAIGQRFGVEVPTETMKSACQRADADFKLDD